MVAFLFNIGICFAEATMIFGLGLGQTLIISVLIDHDLKSLHVHLCKQTCSALISSLPAKRSA